MTRGLERLLRRVLTVLAYGLVLGGAVLCVDVFLSPPVPAAVEFSLPEVAGPKGDSISQPDPKIARLAATRMSKASAAKLDTPQKAPVPGLATLLRVKGIMDYGDPKNNEAIIEIVRANKTANFRVGDTIAEVNAVVTKVDTGVTFDYDGKSVRLNVYSGESVDSRPAAGSGLDGAADATQRVPRQP